MMNAKNRGAIAACVAGLAASAGHAQVSISDSFAYPPGPLVGRDGGLGFGEPWGTAGYGEWLLDAKDTVMAQSGRRYASSGGRVVSSMGGVQRVFANPISDASQTIWVSFMAQQTAHAGPNSWLGVKLPCTGAEPFLFLGKPYGTSTWGSDNGRPGGMRETAVPGYERVRIVARIDLRDGPDDVAIWVKPSFDNPPLDFTADLVLPGYGDFRGIRKALIETGAGAIVDELRIGSTYADVTPVEDGVLVSGVMHHGVDGCTIEPIAQGGVAGRAARLGRNPQTGRCRSSTTVSEQRSGFYELNRLIEGSSASRLQMSHVGADGSLQSTMLASTDEAGTTILTGDLGGMHPERVRVREFNDSGQVVSDEVFPGSGYIKNVTGTLSGGCPDGTAPRWFFAWVLLSEPELNTNTVPPTWTWYKEMLVFGCPGPIIFAGRRIEITPEFADASGFTPEFQSVELEATGSPYLDILSSGKVVGKKGALEIRGNSVDENCDRYVSCGGSDPRSRRAIRGIGSSGQDGCDITTEEPGIQTYMTEIPGLAHSNGQVDFGFEMRCPTGVHFGTVILNTKREGQVTIRPDFPTLSPDAVEVYVLDEHDGVLGHATVPTGVDIDADVNFCVPPNVELWGWMWWNNQWVFGVYGCVGSAVIDFPDSPLRLSGPKIVIVPINDPPIVDAMRTTIRAKNIPDDLLLLDIAIQEAPRGCPADFNGDGFLDFFDYDDFVVAFETGNPDADFNGDGFLDFFDYDDFVVAFETGC